MNSNIKKIREIRTLIGELFKNQNIDPNFTHDVQLAVNEAHANIIEHAYNGNNNGEIIFKFIIYNDKVEILIRDLGEKFNTLSTKKGINYLEELAAKFHRYYSKHRIITEEKEITNCRLFLIDSLRIIFDNGLSVLGIKAKEKM